MLELLQVYLTVWVLSFCVLVRGNVRWNTFCSSYAAWFAINLGKGLLLLHPLKASYTVYMCGGLGEPFGFHCDWILLEEKKKIDLWGGNWIFLPLADFDTYSVRNHKYIFHKKIRWKCFIDFSVLLRLPSCKDHVWYGASLTNTACVKMSVPQVVA